MSLSFFLYSALLRTIVEVLNALASTTTKERFSQLDGDAVMPSSRFLYLNLGHSIDHMFMLMFPAVASLAATDLSSSYGEVLSLATVSFIAFGVFSLPMGWLADRLSREFMMRFFREWTPLGSIELNNVPSYFCLLYTSPSPRDS